jgi:SAM-dependent methyltransferase
VAQLLRGLLVKEDLKQNIVEDFRRKKTEYYDRNYGTANPSNYLRRLRRTLMSDLLSGRSHIGRVLDIGCGPAILFPALLEACQKYYAVDLVPSNLDQIRATNPDSKIECIPGDMDALQWDADYFDVIVCSGAMEYTSNATANLIKLVNWLGHGGLFVCSFPNVASPYRLWSEGIYNPASRSLKALMGQKRPVYKSHLFSFDEIAKQLSEIGVVFSATYFGYKFIPQPFDKIFENVDYRLLTRLQSSPHPRLERYCSEFIVTVSKP